MFPSHDKYAGQYDFIEKEKLHGNDQTKFSQYQLAGEKENYKEVLVTMPKKVGENRQTRKQMVFVHQSITDAHR